MLISKFDLCKSEWLGLVFENRNKEYGAYDLRQHYAGNMVKAMGITFFSIALICGACIILKTTPAVLHNQEKVTTVTLSTITIKHPVVIPKRQTAPIAPVKPLTAVKTQQFTPFVVKPDPETINPPANIDLKGAIGQTTTSGKDNSSNVMPAETNTNTTAQPATDDAIHLPVGLDVMPEPVGGEKAWAKFLGKNLRFPPAAQDDGVNGRVILSFIIEKDGSLSNIVVEQGAGHGFDEEALRVLKLAKAWKPGMQNGQPVRVRYSIPINFQLSE